MTTVNQEIVQIPVSRIKPGPFQPRDRDNITDESVAELAADIEKHGILNHLLVSANGGREYELLAGERRWRAAQLIGLESVPCRVLDGSREELHEIAIVDNLQRENLTPLEEARAFRSLVDLYDYSQRQLARRLNKSQGYVQQRLALLDAAPEVREMVNTRVFTLGHARALSPLPAEVQGVTAEHLGGLHEKNVPITSRQIQNLGQRIKRFLDPARFVGVEDQVMEAKVRNGQIAIRHLLETQPQDALAQAVKRLLDGGRNSSDYKLLGRQKFDSYDIGPVIGLLRNPREWRGIYDRGRWWTDDLATGTGRTCEDCIFYQADAPEKVFPGWTSPCDRWQAKQPITTCENCILPTDAVAIELRPMYHYRGVLGGPRVKTGETFHYVESVADYVQLVEETARRQERERTESKSRERNEYRDRLTAFRQVCEGERNVLDTGHFQAHWCDRCEFDRGGECAFAARPLGDVSNTYDVHPSFRALVQIEDGTDDDKVKVAVRVVPRCEMFRFASAPDVVAAAGVTFAKGKSERRNTVIRWLKVLARFGAGGHGNGIWSALRWLPYSRPRDRHYDLDRLLRYVLGSWDDWGDARIATLLDAAASESTAMNRRSASSSFTLYDPGTGKEERWAVASWSNYVSGIKPTWGWTDEIAWPFVERHGE